MRQGMKTLALAIVIVLLFIMIYNIFSGTAPTQTDAATSSQGNETPFYVSLLISWLPMMVVIVFYILFLQVFNKLLAVGERIAAALEANGENKKVSTGIDLKESNISLEDDVNR